MLTLPLEVERYWKGGRSWASIFFFLNRYMTVLSHIPVVVEFFATMPESVSRLLGQALLGTVPYSPVRDLGFHSRK